ncbi:MAG: hypothetical protein JWL77_5933 [Chthonomonadaceae bacterium]|nr:hypothetical protein [Chthonomonadaceae bacterium]
MPQTDLSLMLYESEGVRREAGSVSQRLQMLGSQPEVMPGAVLAGLLVQRRGLYLRDGSRNDSNGADRDRGRSMRHVGLTTCGEHENGE